MGIPTAMVYVGKFKRAKVFSGLSVAISVYPENFLHMPISRFEPLHHLVALP